MTLVELMIALMVLAIAILGVVGVIVHTIKSKEKSRELDIAKQAAATKLEQLRATPWASLSSLTSPVYAEWDVTELGHSARPSGKAFGSVRVLNAGTADFNPDLLDIEVIIEWVGIGGSTKHSVRSMYTR